MSYDSHFLLSLAEANLGHQPDPGRQDIVIAVNAADLDDAVPVPNSTADALLKANRLGWVEWWCWVVLELGP